MLASLQHPTLIICVFHLFHLDYLRLLQNLDRVEALIVLALDQVDAAERPGTQGTLQCKVIEGVFAFGLAGRVGSALLARNV